MEAANCKLILEDMNKELNSFIAQFDNLSAYDCEKQFWEITDKYNKLLVLFKKEWVAS